ncbi:hypothetical protein A5634_04800 [Mycobacterium asiaticum]|uniref:Uncharacterized protein n=1 Tax=Mycobacterium asiaticum TaxID=1790 RepID=A0A1A3NQW3_MYCAS|nr:hypothetical protein A5634_04800 [Mycobacterium asiaticum]
MLDDLVAASFNDVHMAEQLLRAAEELLNRDGSLLQYVAVGGNTGLHGALGQGFPLHGAHQLRRRGDRRGSQTPTPTTPLKK